MNSGEIHHHSIALSTVQQSLTGSCLQSMLVVPPRVTLLLAVIFKGVAIGLCALWTLTVERSFMVTHWDGMFLMVSLTRFTHSSGWLAVLKGMNFQWFFVMPPTVWIQELEPMIVILHVHSSILFKHAAVFVALLWWQWQQLLAITSHYFKWCPQQVSAKRKPTNCHIFIFRSLHNLMAIYIETLHPG